MPASRVLPEILRLDPRRDHQRICYLSTNVDFPWDTTRSLEFALFRTYCVPRMTAILASTGEFVHRAQKRYDDTVLILAEMLDHGYDSERGRAARRRMNGLHGRHPIPNEDFLYTLSTFIYEPVRWNARFGWRRVTDHERLAGFYYWQEVGRRMNIKDIPDTYEELEQFNVQYERENFRYADSNRIIGLATLAVIESWYPAPIRPLVRAAIHAMIDEPVRAAMDFPHGSPTLLKAIETGLKLRGRALQHLPRRRRPHLMTEVRHKTYPQGYTLAQLGPSSLPWNPGPAERPGVS